MTIKYFKRGNNFGADVRVGVCVEFLRWTHTRVAAVKAAAVVVAAAAAELHACHAPILEGS